MSIQLFTSDNLSLSGGYKPYTEQKDKWYINILVTIHINWKLKVFTHSMEANITDNVLEFKNYAYWNSFLETMIWLWYVDRWELTTNVFMERMLEEYRNTNDNIRFE